jgi:hypothetical protein
MERKIVWTKAFDPFVIDLEKFQPKDGYEAEEEEEYQHPMKKPAYPLKVIVTPAGYITLEEQMFPSKAFNLWVAHTNFDITDDVLAKVEALPGVEILQVITRYRMKIGFGMAYNADDVKADIHETLCYPLRKDLRNLLEAGVQANEAIPESVVEKVMQATFEIKNSWWIAYIVPNGQIKIVKSYDINKDFYEYAATLVAAQAYVGGAIAYKEF